MRYKRGLSYPYRFLKMATACKAKLLCSGVFVSERSSADMLSEDLAVDQLAPLRALSSTVDAEQQRVDVSFLGGFQNTALYRPGLGSTLVLDTSTKDLLAQSEEFCRWTVSTPRPVQTLPTAKMLPQEINEVALTKAVARAFEEDNPIRLKRTRAVVVLYKGEIIAERYAPSFSAETPMLGWSMAKSVVNALIGILVQQGKLSLSAKGLLPEWRQAGDMRGEITLDQLLRMSSGLSFSENYASPLSDVTTMLFQTGDMAAYVGMRSLSSPPGSVFCYASGATVLLCRIIREALGGSLSEYFAFPRLALFDRLGMTSAVLEPDAAGTFTGSSFMYATTQDWAKLGLLFLQDGCWQIKGKWERILPQGWVAYSSAPSETADFYGAHFWRGVPNSFVPETGDRSGWPEDAFLASGYQGQFMTVVPSRDLVVVRMGLSQRKHSWDQVGFLSQIADAIKASEAED